jgi:general secretion pathway protein K
MLLVFALATMMISDMARTSYLALRRTGNLVDSVQARYYALGAEELGRLILAEDASARGQGGGMDHLREPWAAGSQSFEIEDGRLELVITDLAGRFNLNSLVDANGKTDPLAVARLAKLLRVLDIDPLLAEAVADWIDTDTNTQRGSSEISSWGVAMPNAPLVEPGELRVLPALDADAWARFAPLVAALPREARLNVNTASAEVLQAFTGRSTAADVERFVHMRDMQPIRDVNDPALASLFAESRTALDVSSGNFELLVHAQYRGRHARLASRVERDPKTARVTILGRGDATRM